MLVLSCRDLGFEHCEFVATGDSARRVKAAMFVQVRDEHSRFIAGLTVDEREEIRLAMDDAMARRLCYERARASA